LPPPTTNVRDQHEVRSPPSDRRTRFRLGSSKGLGGEGEGQFGRADLISFVQATGPSGPAFTSALSTPHLSKVQCAQPCAQALRAGWRPPAFRV